MRKEIVKAATKYLSSILLDYISLCQVFHKTSYVSSLLKDRNYHGDWL